MIKQEKCEELEEKGLWCLDCSTRRIQEIWQDYKEKVKELTKESAIYSIAPDHLSKRCENCPTWRIQEIWPDYKKFIEITELTIACEIAKQLGSSNFKPCFKSYRNFPKNRLACCFLIYLKDNDEFKGAVYDSREQ